MPSEASVLVVGAGPTGLLLASELWRRRVPCRLIDAHGAPLHWDRATVLHARSLEVIEALGLAERFLAAGVAQRFVRLHSGGSVLGEIDLSLCGSRYGFNLGLSEEGTEALLAEHLHRLGGEVARGSRLVELENRADAVLATIDRDGHHETIGAQWVVGCDGLHSPTREHSGIALAGHDIARPWAVFDATLRGWSEPYEANYAYLDDVPVILTALPGRRWRVYLRPSAAQSDLVADAAATLGPYHPAVAFDVVANPTRFRCHSKVAKRFRSGRVLLAGDAAHVCSPAQGHGMNSGLQDAFNLAWKLALVCQGRATPALLDSYEAERRPVAEAIVASGDATDRAQLTRDAVGRHARDQALRTALADSTSRHHEAIAEAELDVDYGDSPIVLGDAHPALGPGQRLPDTIEVGHAGGARTALHALAHRAAHTALVIGRTIPEDALEALADAIRAREDGLVGATIALTTRSGGPHAWLADEDAARLGVDATTLLVIRPDGHVGLRADREHATALAAYQALLARGGRPR